MSDGEFGTAIAGYVSETDGSYEKRSAKCLDPSCAKTDVSTLDYSQCYFQEAGSIQYPANGQIKWLFCGDCGRHLLSFLVYPDAEDDGSYLDF